MQLHIFGENKSYKHFINRLAYKNQKVSFNRHGRQLTETDTGLAALSNATKCTLPSYPW